MNHFSNMFLHLFLTSFVSYFFNDGFFSSVLKSALICFSFGLFIMLLSKNPKKIINRRDGYLIVVLGWLTMVFSGMLPYIFTNTIDKIPDLIFETMYLAGQMDKPGRGIMYMSKLDRIATYIPENLK